MAASHALAPPDYDENKTTWREYKKEIEVWSSLTSLPKEKHGPALWMALKGKAKEAVKEMEISEIKVENGLGVMITKLDKLFKTDDNQAAYLAYRDFENLIRPTEMNFQDFIIKFEASNSEIRRHKMELPDGVLAYRFLHSANLKDDEIKLCRATISDFTYDEMKKKVLSLFGDKVQCKSEEMAIKSEPVFYAQQNNKPEEKWNDHRPFDASWNKNRFHESSWSDSSRKPARGWNRGRGGGQRRGSDQAKHEGRDRFVPQKSTNPQGPNGKPRQCGIFSSIYHFARNCPEVQEESNSKSNNIAFVQKEDDNEQGEVISLFQDTDSNTDSLKWFLGETIGCAVVDSGCSKTVAGSKWVECFLESLNNDDLLKIERKESNEMFKFGKGESTRSSGKIVIPVEFGRQKVKIESDIVDADIPLLLSKEALKKAETVLDFNNDSAVMFGVEQTLIATESGHYAIPLSIAKQRNAEEQQIALVVNTTKKIDKNDLIVPFKIATKLHRQFCHCSANKLVKLIKESNLWPTDEMSDIIREVKNVTENCNICKRYKRSPSTPVVCCSLSSFFNEVVAMDLIEIQGKNILHLIDMFSRYSAACVRNSKKQEDITEGIMKIWISYFGKPVKFLADNGGEFANQTYTDMCAVFGIEIMKTSAESPWSNGLAERHNGVLKVSTMKIIEDTGCNLQTGVAWAVSAKNTLNNNFGYSSNMIVFGKNPSFPSVLSDNITALTAENVSQVVEENMKAMHTARKAFIEAESSEKIKRALAHNIRTSCEENYQNGERVYFKRDDSKRWYGPGTVIGQDGKQVLVRNGSQMVRVHKTRLNRVGKEFDVRNGEPHNQNISDVNENRHSEECLNCELDEESSIVNGEVQLESDRNISSESERTSIDMDDNCTETENGSSARLNQDKKVDPRAEIDGLSTEAETLIEQCENTHKNARLHPKVKTHILYKLNDDADWKKGFVHSRAGKVGGKYESHFNIKDENNEIKEHDFGKDVSQWEPIPNEVMVTTQDKEAISAAKHKEIENWKSNEVFEVVPFNNQKFITTRWVITTKEKNSAMITKARLVARGFEDQGKKGSVDSPTCSKESLALLLSLLALKKWQCQAIDIKTAFLQGNRLERDVYLKPPKEYENGNNLWKLKKAVYGLNEASRAWYNRVENEFERIGLKM